LSSIFTVVTILVPAHVFVLKMVIWFGAKKVNIDLFFEEVKINYIIINQSTKSSQHKKCQKKT